jgi:16S rRNA processing protein RimM
MTVVASHTAGKKSRVHLDGVDDRTAAEALTGTKLFAEPIDDPDELWVHDLIGASVVEVGGVDRGRCVAVVANPASDLLELDGGALVPAVFVTGVERDGPVTVVTIEPPDGLFELNGS